MYSDQCSSQSCRELGCGWNCFMSDGGRICLLIYREEEEEVRGCAELPVIHSLWLPSRSLVELPKSSKCTQCGPICLKTGRSTELCAPIKLGKRQRSRRMGWTEESPAGNLQKFEGGLRTSEDIGDVSFLAFCGTERDWLDIRAASGELKIFGNS